MDKHIKKYNAWGFRDGKFMYINTYIKVPSHIKGVNMPKITMAVILGLINKSNIKRFYNKDAFELEILGDEFYIKFLPKGLRVINYRYKTDKDFPAQVVIEIIKELQNYLNK